MIYIENIDETSVRINSTQGIIMELYDSFSFRVKNYQFMPSYKMGYFDGYIRLINRKNNTAPKGLVPDIIDWCTERSYEVKIDSKIKESFSQKIDFKWEDLNLPFTPRDFQENAVDIILRKKRQLILSSTGSGKSLIIYAMIRAFQSAIEEHEKILLVVPNISLVEQMFNDFKSYAKNSDWVAEGNCHMIYGGKDKDTDKQIVISTWQSIYKLPPQYFHQFKAILGDEVHTFEAKSCTTIMNNAINAFFRVGLTGTLADSNVHELQLKSLFGPISRVSSTKDLMERNILAKLSIKAIILKYGDEDCSNIKGAVYKDEIDYIISHKGRLNFIANLSTTRKGNTLVLFQYVTKHGKPLFEAIKEAAGSNKKVHMVYGGTEADQREQIRKIAETHNDVIIVASYGVYSTGINIVNLKNIIFASPTKSKIKVLQSVGRGLRKGEDKDECILYDVADDFRNGKKKINYTLQHFSDRYSIYIKEGFEVIVKEVKI